MPQLALATRSGKGRKKPDSNTRTGAEGVQDPSHAQQVSPVQALGQEHTWLTGQHSCFLHLHSLSPSARCYNVPPTTCCCTGLGEGLVGCTRSCLLPPTRLHPVHHSPECCCCIWLSRRSCCRSCTSPFREAHSSLTCSSSCWVSCRLVSRVRAAARCCSTSCPFSCRALRARTISARDLRRSSSRFCTA